MNSEKPLSLEENNLESGEQPLPLRWYEIPKKPSLNKKTQLYSLNEAAEIAGIPTKSRELIEAGKTEALELMVPIPYGYRLGLIRPFKRRWINNSPFCRLPNLVILGPSCCDDLLLFGKAQVRNAPKGYTWIPSELQLDELFPKDILLFPNAEQREYCTPETDWYVYKSGSEDPLEVTIGDIRIAETEIYRFLGLDADKAENVGDEYKSDMLQIMNHAALEFWGLSVRNQKPGTSGKKTNYLSEKYNLPSWKKQDIVKYFIDRGFKRNLAETAEGIIRQDYKRLGRPEEKDNFDDFTNLILDKLKDERGFHKSQKLNLMNETAKKFWGDAKVEKGMILSYPTDTKISRWLIQQGFGDKAFVINAVSILKPEFAS